jgi:hypothetical protein
MFLKHNHIHFIYTAFRIQEIFFTLLYREFEQLTVNQQVIELPTQPES